MVNNGKKNRHNRPKRATTGDYFKKLNFRVKLGLLLSLIVPVSVLSLYFHFQFNYTLKNSGKLHLSTLAESERNTIDLFLQERVVNIFSLLHSSDFSASPTKSDMEHYIENLRQMSDAFVDVGFFNPMGIQTGYAGPFPFLYDKDYSKEKWFSDLLGHKKNYYISDIYLGFRNKPHFTIAVKQIIDQKPYVMRATLDPERFYQFISSISRGKGIESFLINQKGAYQVVSLTTGKPLRKSQFIPSDQDGVSEIEVNGEKALVSHVWLKEVHWALIAMQPLRNAFQEMYKARNILIAGSMFLLIIISGFLWMITDRLLKKAQLIADSRENLKYQLIQASKLASIGELATGIAHEINNPLAIISAESGVLKDMFNPEFDLDNSPDKVREELGYIDDAVSRARVITKELLNYGRKNEPKLIPSNVNSLLDHVLEGIKEHEFKVSNINVVKNYENNLPLTLIDPNQISQVFLNLINNAGDAIGENGTITVSTRSDEAFVRVTVKDTGSGMNSEQLKNIFVPFFTTKAVGKGTGLGLSISLGIVESMGGKMEVQSIEGTGSSFTVLLPVSNLEKNENE